MHFHQTHIFLRVPLPRHVLIVLQSLITNSGRKKEKDWRSGARDCKGGRKFRENLFIFNSFSNQKEELSFYFNEDEFYFNSSSFYSVTLLQNSIFPTATTSKHFSGSGCWCSSWTPSPGPGTRTPGT